jgi:hypothetical protein
MDQNRYVPSVQDSPKIARRAGNPPMADPSHCTGSSTPAHWGFNATARNAEKNET